jgi:hypothetical protein
MRQKLGLVVRPDNSPDRDRLLVSFGCWFGWLQTGRYEFCIFKSPLKHVESTDSFGGFLHEGIYVIITMESHVGQCAYVQNVFLGTRRSSLALYCSLQLLSRAPLLGSSALWTYNVVQSAS